jgi:hypothetical protein
MVAAEANCVFKRPQLNFFAAGIEAEKLEALAVNKSKIWLRPTKETLRRSRSGLDPNLAQRDLDHLAVPDQEPDATQVAASPHWRDGVKLVFGPAETEGLVGPARGNEPAEPNQRRPPVRLADVRRSAIDGT